MNPGIFSALEPLGMPTSAVFTTTYVESTAGVAVGGRSGLTAFVVAVCFALALFLGPMFLAIPAFVTMIMMPLSYSISDGIMLGLIMYVLMKVGSGKKGIRQIGPTVWVLFVIFVLRYIQQSLSLR